MKRKKLRLGRIIWVLICIMVLIYLGNFILAFNYDSFRLKQLNYSKIAIEEIKKNKLEDYIIAKKKYSKTLEKALTTKQFIAKNIDLYYSLDYRDDDNFITNINSLADIGYDKTKIILIFKHLNSEEIEALTKLPLTNNIEQYIIFDYFKVDNLERYLNYRNKNKNMELEKIITHVNIGLDYPYYGKITYVDDYDKITVLTNKYRQLPETFVPKNLVEIDKAYAPQTFQLTKIAGEAFEKMANDMKKNDLHIQVVSAYRSFAYQANLYNKYVAQDGKTKAETYSARPGHSEHQTGLAIDISGNNYAFNDFDKSKEYQWIKDNAHLYGYIIRYPKGKENITGYQYEPWHLRYVGVDIATYIYNHKITFDEYYVKFLEQKK
jgi:D-alanyl-D-alanine carboxypeptidase